MTERTKKVSSIFYYYTFNENKNEKTLKSRVFRAIFNLRKISQIVEYIFFDKSNSRAQSEL